MSQSPLPGALLPLPLALSQRSGDDLPATLFLPSIISPIALAGASAAAPGALLQTPAAASPLPAPRARAIPHAPGADALSLPATPDQEPPEPQKPVAAPSSSPPAVATEPLSLRRGSAPWSDARVEALIREGLLDAAWLPDIRATALTHLQIQNAKQRELLRFSNAIANTGEGTWQVRRGSLISDPEQIADAVSLGLDPGQLAATAQELLAADGAIAAVVADAALSEFHPEHKHFHIGETAEFGVERFDSTSQRWDPITGLEVVKTTFCLIDVNQIQQVSATDPDHYDIIKSPANANLYNDCFADLQGIQAGWIDRYNHSLPGQQVDITDLPAGTYRITSTVNPAGWFLESDYSNNTGWTGFELSRDSNGNAKLTTIPGAFGGIWFDSSSNGMG
jgi:hypothetical protein